MIRLGLRPNSSGGINEPRRLLAPLPGISDGLLLPTGVVSRITSILGVSCGATISGNLGYNSTKNHQQSTPHDTSLINFYLVNE